MPLNFVSTEFRCRVQFTLATDESNLRIEALYLLARQCISLALSLDEDFDDGTSASTPDSMDCTWDLGVAATEIIACARVVYFAMLYGCVCQVPLTLHM